MTPREIHDWREFASDAIGGGQNIGTAVGVPADICRIGSERVSTSPSAHNPVEDTVVLSGFR